MKKERIICFGDSITQGQGYAEADRWTARLAFLLEEKMPGRWEVFNRGTGGNTTAFALDRIQTDVLPLLPGLVLIEFGINDAYVLPWCRTSRVGLIDYRKNLGDMIRQIRVAKGKPLLIVNHPVTLRKNLHRQGNGSSIGKQLIPYNRTVRRLAKQREVQCLDLPELLKRRKVSAKTFLSEDGVHLSAEGNRVYANILFEQVISLA